MNIRGLLPSILASALMLGASLRAHAQIPVTDVGAIIQLVTEVNTLEQELQTAREHLTQARQTYQSLTGTRGMQGLLNNAPRNYLPADATQLQATLNGAGGIYGALAASVQGSIAANAVLPPQTLATLSPAERNEIQARRAAVALLQGISQQALAITSARFAAVQQLIDAIPTATDPKAILDLQARIAAEQGMLQNENTKLGVLYQTAQAAQWAERQREQEQGIADIGSLRRLAPMGL